MKRTEDDFKDVKGELERLHLKIDQLWNFRSLLVGGTMALSAALSVVINLIVIYFDLRK